MSVRGQFRSRRGIAILMVLWGVVIGAIIVSAVQTASFGQAASGRESLARVRAYWAARAGIEATIAKIEGNTLEPSTTDAFRIFDDCAGVAEGELPEATYRVAQAGTKGEILGPGDEHAKLNINALTPEQLLNITPVMTEDVVAGILDWIDGDDEALPLGAEAPFYQSLPHPYWPRNAAMRSIQELELVGGATAVEVRGEDWNLDGVLDANEDDGDESYPPDNADGKLDAGWSGVLTASSVEGGLTASGQPALDLTTASQGEVEKRSGADSDQSKAIIDYVTGNPNASMRDFILRNLSTLQDSVTGKTGAERSRVPPLSDEQLGKLLDEAEIGTGTTGAKPGKLNINTCAAETLQMLPDIDGAVADAIIAEREATPNGFTSIVQIKSIPGIGRRQFANIYDLLTVKSNVYTITSRGRDTNTGVEVEVIATVDRSTLPLVIKELRTQ